MGNANLVLKRVFDIVLSVIGILVMIPVYIVLGLCVKLGSKGPVFFKQIRVGRDGKNFKILKFRTMAANAEKKGLSITVGEDRRITKIGRVLRKAKLDELPQMFNILKGDMSFVGPRPEVPKYVELYDDEQREILKVRPGMTDYASICFRNENEILAQSADPEEEYIKKVMPLKIKYNMKYINEMSLFTDIKILFLTICAVLGRKVEIDI